LVLETVEVYKPEWRSTGVIRGWNSLFDIRRHKGNTHKLLLVSDDTEGYGSGGSAKELV
jgi:hypothetical protein